MNENIENKLLKILQVFLGVVPFFLGVFFEWTSAVLCVFLLGYLFYCNQKRKVYFNHNWMLWAMLVIVLFYGLSIFWAVDQGMVVYGITKFLPLPLFCLAIAQLREEQRNELMKYIPISAFLMCLISFCLSKMPFFSDYFLVNHRQAGFFLYPNTYALFLILGLIVLLYDKSWDIKKIVYIGVFILGIGLTGSRAGFLLLFLICILYAIGETEKKNRWLLLGLVATMIVGMIGFAIFTGDKTPFGRLLKISMSSSTFLGRVLYFKDVIPVIMKHPFGLGYLGYHFSQGAFQTGVYTVRNVHNDFLELLLDIGWIPTLFFVFAIWKGFKKANKRNRMLIGSICLYSLFDFHLQFLAITLILIAAIAFEDFKKKKAIGSISFVGVGVIVGCFSIYFGITSALYYSDKYEIVTAMYPNDTNAWMKQMVQTDDLEELEKISDRVLYLNPNNALANTAKARVSYSRGQFTEMIHYKKIAISNAKYNLEEYLDYFDMLYVGYQLYLKNGDIESAKICAQCMNEIPQMIEKVLQETDDLAYRIKDKPKLELPKEYEYILTQIKL